MRPMRSLFSGRKAHDLSLGEWRDFLRDMSQDDLVKLLGQPTSQADDYWIYSGGWVLDPATGQKSGMVINFNAGRVISVVEKRLRSSCAGLNVVVFFRAQAEGLRTIVAGG